MSIMKGGKLEVKRVRECGWGRTRGWRGDELSPEVERGVLNISLDAMVRIAKA